MTTPPAPFRIHGQGHRTAWPWPHLSATTRTEADTLARDLLAAGHPQVEIDEHRGRRGYCTIDQLRAEVPLDA